MNDVLTPEQRHFCMSQIRGKNTKPELLVRNVLYTSGYRYRLHGKQLPGKPDIFFKSRKKAILIHGCYWHRHSCSKGNVTPKTNQKFWKEKFDKNTKSKAAFDKLMGK